MLIRSEDAGTDARAPVVASMAIPTLPHAGPRTVPGDPAPRERRHGAERRAVPDRRLARRDRRRGRPDHREVRVERRAALADPRSGRPAPRRRRAPPHPGGGGGGRGAPPPPGPGARPPRGRGGTRRNELGAAPGPPPVDPDVVFWVVNVVCWAAVTLVALLYGA